MRADHANAFALDDRGNAGEQSVVAAAKELRQPGRALHRAPVEPEIGKFGPRHRADDHEFGDGARFQGGEQLADLAHPDPDVRIGFDRRIGRPDDADQKRLPAGAARLARDLERKRAGAAEDGQRTRGASARTVVRPAHPSSSFPARGTQIARSPALAQKGDDLLHRVLVGERFGDLVDALLQRASPPLNSIL